MCIRAIIAIDDKEFVFFPTDLEHFDEALKLLRKNHQYTAAERLGVARSLLTKYLSEGGA